MNFMDLIPYFTIFSTFMSLVYFKFTKKNKLKNTLLLFFSFLVLFSSSVLIYQNSIKIK